MILQLSLFQIFFMALSIVGLSFSILYLFIGGYNYDSSAEAYSERNQERRNADRKEAQRPRETARSSRENVVDISSGKRREAKPVPQERTSVGRQNQRAQPSMRVLEVDYKVVHNRTNWEEVTMDTISITGRVASGTGRW